MNENDKFLEENQMVYMKGGEIQNSKYFNPYIYVSEKDKKVTIIGDRNSLKTFAEAILMKSKVGKNISLTLNVPFGVK